MKNIVLIAVAVCAAGLAVSARGVENLVRNGDMNDEKLLPREVRCAVGKMTVGVEDASWNKYVRLTVDKILREKSGEEKANACMRIGMDAQGSEGFPLAGGELYEYSLDMRGTAPRVTLSVAVETAEGKTVSVPTLPNEVKGLTSDWVRQTGTFRTPPEAKRGQFVLLMYWEGKWGGMPYKAGDYADIDNVRIARRSGRFEEFAAKCDKPFVVAPVPVTSDVHLPFVPEELFAAPSNITLTAAGNEHKALPIAIANLTDATEEYRMTLETTHPSERLTKSDGRFGLSGFPSAQVTAWRGVVVKDKDPDMAKTYKACGHDVASMKIGRIIDPLVELGVGSVVAVPPKSARLVWFDFDTTGVSAGDYEGLLRVIPLSAAVSIKDSPSSWHDFTLTGDMADVPVKLTVLPFELPREPVVAGNIFCAADSEQMFRMLVQLGQREFMVSPWAFTFKLDRPTATFGAYQPPTWDRGDARLVLHDYKVWAAASGVPLRVFVGYNCYETFKKLYGIAPKNDSDETMKLWGRWVAAVKEMMNDCGFPDDTYALEIWDEPNRPTKFDTVIASLKAAQAAAPTMRRICTFNYNPWEPADFEAVAPYLNGWIFYDGKNLGSAWEKYGPVIKKYIARGDYVSHYTCSVKCDEDLDKYYRQNAWQAERYGLTGNALFEATSGRGGLGALNWKRSPSSDILYRAYDRFLPSVRAMALRQGVEDVKYLKVLKNLAKDDAETLAFVREAAERVTRNPAGGDRYLADKVRDEIATRILKLMERPLR